MSIARSLRYSVFARARLAALYFGIFFLYFPSQAWASPIDLPPSPAPTASDSHVEQREIVVPGGTPISVALTDKISSGTAKVGDTFGIRATRDIAIDGYVVVSKGAGGQGEVLAVEKSGSHGHAGSLGVRINWIYAVNGEKIRLANHSKTDEGENKSGVSSTMTILSWAILGPVGLFTHNFVKGHDMEIDSTHAIECFVDNSVHIVSSLRLDSNAGFAH